MDLADVDIARAEAFQRARAYLADRTVETLGLLYAMHWPHYQPTSARGARRLPYHERCAGAGAVFGEVQGWERPLFYAEGRRIARDRLRLWPSVLARRDRPRGRGGRAGRSRSSTSPPSPSSR